MFAQLINRINRNDARQDAEVEHAPGLRTPSIERAVRPTSVASDDADDDDLALLHAALDWIDAPLTVFDRALVLRHANRAYCELVGKTPADVIGRHLDELSFDEAPDSVRGYFERALAGESLDVDIAHRADGVDGHGPLDGAGRVEYRPQRDAHGDVIGVIAVLQRLGRRRADRVDDPFDATRSSVASSPAPGFSPPMRAALRIAQDDLIERERKQRELIESLPLPFVFVGADGRCKWANQAFCDALAIDCDAIHDRAPAALSPIVGDVVERGVDVAAHGAVHTVEASLALDGRAARWFRIDFIPGFDRNGFQSGVYVLFVDIHEARLSSLVVEQDAARDRGFAERIPESIVFVDRDLAVRYVNRRAADDFGRARDEIVGHAFGELVGGEAAGLHRASLARALAGETVADRRRDAFGAGRGWRELRYLPFDATADQAAGVYVVARGIDDPAAAEADGSAFASSAAGDVPAQISSVDAGLRYRDGNPRFLADHGIASVDALRGRTVADVLGAAEGDEFASHAAVALRGEPVQYERRVSLDGGETRWQRVTMLGDLAADGGARGLFTIAYDITAAKAADDSRTRQQQWVERFVENFPQPLAYLDTGGVHRYANRAYGEFVGRPSAAVVGQSAVGLFEAASTRRVEADVARALGGERLHGEYDGAKSGGAPRHVAIDWMPDASADGTVRGVYCLAQDVGPTRLARLAHEQSLREMQRAMDSVALPISFVDSDERLRFVNDTTTKWYGRPAAELLGLPMRELMSDDDYAFAAPYIRAAIAGESVHYEREMRYHDGMRRWVLLRYVPTRDEHGAVTGFYTTAIDIQSRKKQEIALQQANALLTAHFENTPLASFTLDGAGRITRWSTQAETLLGWRRDEVIDRPFDELGLVATDIAPDFVPPVEARDGDGGNLQLRVVETTRRDGSVAMCEWHLAALRDAAGRLTSTLALVQDVSHRIEAERRLTEIAQRDTLTRLLNRNALEPTLRAFIERARQGGTGVAVLFLDLDHFKNINDTLGHRVGDLMLVEVARILRNCVRAEDEVARIGGDEFMIVIGHARPKTIAHETAQRIITALGTPIRVENQRLSVAASIGIAVYPDHGRAPEALVRSADLAMYRAKENGKNRFEFFSAMLAQRSERRGAVKAALKLTLQRDGLRLYFQPRVRISDGRIVGAEALLRWTDARLGVVSPKEFIGIAEESGLIHELGLHVFRKACRQLRDWQDRGIPLGVLSVNFSAHQLLVATFIDEVDHVIEETGVDPRYVEVEITETSMLFDLGVTKNVIADLKHRGMRIAIDDFGTGFSSLSHLQQLDVDTLKVDQSFIRDMLHDSGDAAITMSVISLARGLKLSTTAEGVENDQQLQALRLAGCDYYQGFLFSPAIVVEDIEALLAEQGPNPHPI